MADLLPGNATAQERALAAAASRAAGVPVPIRDLWSPETCPPTLLPWLAWAFSVDDWSPSWTEAQKRATIRAAIDVHRRKGTRNAVETALSALNLQLQITEWLDRDPPGAPYTFAVSITSDVDAPAGSRRDLRAVLSIIDRTKSLRSHITAAQVITGGDARLSAGAAPALGHDLRLEYGGSVEPDWIARIHAAAAPLVASVLTVGYGGPVAA